MVSLISMAATTEETIALLQTVPVFSSLGLEDLAEVAAAREDGAGDGDVLITATQTELAQLAGSSRESASRFLAVLERAGVITQGRGKLTVHNAHRLEGYVY